MLPVGRSGVAAQAATAEMVPVKACEVLKTLSETVTVTFEVPTCRRRTEMKPVLWFSREPGRKPRRAEGHRVTLRIRRDKRQRQRRSVPRWSGSRVTEAIGGWFASVQISFDLLPSAGPVKYAATAKQYI
jgi:hypothetical protein